MRVQLTVKIQTIFQEQEVNNGGIPLRVHITIVVSRLMHFKHGLLYRGAQWWRAACAGRVCAAEVDSVCVCVQYTQFIHPKIKSWKVRGLPLCLWSFSLQI